MSIEYQLIVVIGLPASGKTTYCTNLKGYVIYDDFMDTFIGSDLLKLLKNGKQVCINDPRMCNIKQFQYYMNIIEEILSKSRIKLILFKNNPDQCKINTTLRVDTLGKTHRHVKRSIDTLTTYYNINNYINIGYSIEILDVYKKNYN